MRFVGMRCRLHTLSMPIVLLLHRRPAPRCLLAQPFDQHHQPSSQHPAAQPRNSCERLCFPPPPKDYGTHPPTCPPALPNQVVGCCLRISCRTPVLGSTLGMLGVGFASALSGQAALHAKRVMLAAAPTQQGPPSARRGAAWWRPAPVRADEALLDAAFGILVFKLAGGRFGSLMPSDLAQPGALAFESIPAQGGDYATPGVKRELVRIFRRDGCHHCGGFGSAAGRRG